MRKLLALLALLVAVPAAAQSGTILNPKILQTVRYANMYADSGTGATGSCWAYSGSNPVQHALDSCPATGCDIVLPDGCYTLGSADPAVTIPVTTAASDTRVYRIIGQGPDKSVLNYSGTGTAIRYWQVHNGTPGQSIQSNANTLRGFTLRQTGTGRTGNGVWLNYARNWIIDDVNFGTPLSNRAAGDQGFSYGLRFDEKSGGYQTVDDFITVKNCRFSGNTHAFFAGQQSDNLRVVDSYFEANPNVAQAQDGLEIKNSNGVSVENSGFLLFNPSSSFGIKLTGDITGVSIRGNYMEGNLTGIFLNSTADQDGISITGNIITDTSVTGGSALDAGINGSSFKVRGLVISGNTFDGIDTSDFGVKIHDNVQGYSLVGNHYNVIAGTATVFAVGSSGTRLEEGTSGLSYSPSLTITEPDNTLSLVTLANSKSGGTSSPSIYFSPDPGITSPNIILRAGVGSSAAQLNLVNNAGSIVGTWLQTGAYTSVAGITGTSFTGPLTGNVTGDVTGGLTAGPGKSVIATAATMRVPNGTLAARSPTCTIGDVYFCTDCTLGQQWQACSSTNVWTLQGDGGGSVAFSALGGGTNTTAAMVVGTGGTLAASGSGTITATAVPGTGVSGNISGTAANVSGTVTETHGGTNQTTYSTGNLLFASAANTLSKLAFVSTATRYLANTGSAATVPAWDQVDLTNGVKNALTVTNGGTGLTTGTSGGVPYFNATSTMASSGLLATNGIVYGGGSGTAPASSAATVTSGGSIALPTAQTLDIAAHATDGGSLVLKEGADDGTNVFTLKVPNSGLSGDKTITLQADGAIPATGVEGTGTASKCARFDASHVLVEASGDCSAGGGGTGTVTGVGPGCTTGLCYTNGTATAGTTMLDWEGTTVDAADFTVTVPADPTANYNLIVPDGLSSITLPTGTDTLIGKATTDTLTNKTLNVESTGNVITTVEKVWLPAAGCNGSTAGSFWDLPTAGSAPTPACVTGTNTQKAYLDFPDSDGAFYAQTSLPLPSDWAGNIDAKIKWLSSTTTGDVFWQLSTICVADAETDDPAFNTASTVADTVKGTTNQTNDATLTSITITGCAAGELMHIKLMRDRTNGSDTLGAAAARLIGVELTLRRGQ